MIGWPRIALGLVSAIALAALLFLANDRFHQKHLADDARICAVAAADVDDMMSLATCLPRVRAEIVEARQARACQKALLPSLRDETRFVMQQTCGAGTKAQVARADAAIAERDSLAGQLAEARAGTAAAVTRAETRATRFEGKEARGRVIVNGAPQTGRGTLRCDTECLRQLTQ